MKLSKGPAILVAVAATSLGIASIAPVLASSPPYSATPFAPVSSPIGVAATTTQVLVTSGYFPNAFGQGGETIDSLASSGTYTSVGTVPAATAAADCAAFYSALGSDNVEAYLAVSPGLGGFAAGNLYVTDGPCIWQYTPNSSGGFNSPTLFTTVPQIASQQPSDNPELAVGITFDTVGTYGYDMILTSVDGSIYTVNSSGGVTQLTQPGSLTNAPLGTYIEGPAVAPLSFMPYGGDLIVASETSPGTVYAYNPSSLSGAMAGTEFVPIASVPSAENVQVVPASVCSFGSSGDAWFSATYGQGQVSALPAADLSPYAGDLIINSEYPADTTAGSYVPNATVLAPNSDATGVTTTSLVDNLAQQEGQAVVQCPPPSGGFVTGGGNLDDVNGNNLTFGFVAHMVNGSPSGHTTVVEHSTSGINFQSTGYSSISVSGCIATYSGTGTVNGSGTYNFTVTAVDSRMSGCPYATDEFGIQITDATTGTTAFYQPLSPLEQGSGIQIH